MIQNPEAREEKTDKFDDIQLKPYLWQKTPPQTRKKYLPFT